MIHWHIAFTSARAEQDACADINAIGFQAYCPMERHKRFRHGIKIIVETALFPRYLFARFDADEPHWNEIREVDGIGGILCNQNNPSPVPAGLTEKLMRMQRLGLFDSYQGAKSVPARIARLMLDDDGPFAELIAQGLAGSIVRSMRCAIALSRPGNDGQRADGKVGPCLVENNELAAFFRMIICMLLAELIWSHTICDMISQTHN